MSAANLILKNPVDEDIKAVPLGFSWAVLLLGFLVPLHRRDWRGTCRYAGGNIFELRTGSPPSGCFL